MESVQDQTTSVTPPTQPKETEKEPDASNKTPRGPLFMLVAMWYLKMPFIKYLLYQVGILKAN